MKFASCDGCQLQLLDLEDELLALCEQFDIIEFAEATSARSDGPFDVLFVEGSISAPEHLPRIKELREQAKFLVTIGACATSGGIQALRNWGDHEAFRTAVYAHPEFVASLATSTPIAEHVKVDAELRGCPIDPRQLIELLTAFTTGRRPQLRDEAVCMECKRAGNTCVMVTRAHAVPGPGDADRLRRDLPPLRPRLLRLFRAARAGQRQGSGRLPADQGAHGAGRSRPPVRRLLRQRRAVPQRRHPVRRHAARRERPPVGTPGGAR